VCLFCRCRHMVGVGSGTDLGSMVQRVIELIVSDVVSGFSFIFLYWVWDAKNNNNNQPACWWQCCSQHCKLILAVVNLLWCGNLFWWCIWWQCQGASSHLKKGTINLLWHIYVGSGTSGDSVEPKYHQGDAQSLTEMLGNKFLLLLETFGFFQHC